MIVIVKLSGSVDHRSDDANLPTLSRFSKDLIRMFIQILHRLVFACYWVGVVHAMRWRGIIDVVSTVGIDRFYFRMQPGFVTCTQYSLHLSELFLLHSEEKFNFLLTFATFYSDCSWFYHRHLFGRSISWARMRMRSRLMPRRRNRGRSLIMRKLSL